MQVRIYKPTRSSMQSGEAKDKWILEYIALPSSKFIEGLMGRTSSKDMMSEVVLEFSSKEEAVDFAESKKYHFELIEPKSRTLIKKSYASNFK